MASGKWKLYEAAKANLGKAIIDLDNLNMKVALFTSASNANTLSVGTGVYGDLTNEVASTFGYTTGGVALSVQTFTQVAGVATFDCNDPTWTAAGGTLTARYAVIYVDATVGGVVKPLLCVCLMDTTPADITVVDGNILTIITDPTGVFQLSGGTVD